MARMLQTAMHVTLTQAGKGQPWNALVNGPRFDELGDIALPSTSNAADPKVSSDSTRSRLRFGATMGEEGNRNMRDAWPGADFGRDGLGFRTVGDGCADAEAPVGGSSPC